ncbi:Heterogeneous nuclear ribonucleoprotein M [Geodia barretti]|nr:Heterogeneous nuclear ribonucleoprotein M [Geodia barretti]
MRVEDREKAGIAPSNPKLRPPPNPSATVFVANLDYSLTWQKLRDIFRVAGKIVHVDMLADPDGRPKGCASVQFETTNDAVNAIVLFHGQLLQNRPMVVRMDSKSHIQPDPIQLKLHAGKGGGGAGILSSHPTSATVPPLMGGGGAPAGMAGSIPLSPSFTQSLGSSPLSPSSLTSQLPILAALGLSALSNLRHFSSDQLALLGINPGHLGGGGGWKMVGNGRGSSGFHGHRGTGSLPPVPEHGQEGLLSQFPFDPPGGLFERERSLPPLGSSLGLRPPPQNSSHYSATMATDLSLATALAAPPHPSSLLYSRHDPLGDGIGGRKGKKLFVRNLNFGTTWQKLKDYMKAAGAINYVDVLKNEDGRSRGCAAVVFESENDAERAIRLFDQSELDGRRISVTFDRSN